MALPVVIAKNQTGTPILLPRLGVEVPASPATITLTDFATFYEVSADEELNTRVGTGDIVINDGTSDLTLAEALGYLDATGNLNGPTTGVFQGRILRLADTTGRYTETANMKVYDSSAGDPVTPVPDDGDIYFNLTLDIWMSYDSVRGKWLSLEGDSFRVGQNGTTPVGAYYKGMAGKTFSASLGYTAPFNGTVVTLTYSRTNVTSTAFEVMANGVQIASVSSAATSGFVNNLNANFSQGDILSVRNDASGDLTRDAQVWVRMRWRA